MDHNFGKITPKKFSGPELLHYSNSPTNFSVLDFWRWAGSDLISNTFRGWFAEFIVATDIGIVSGVRQTWAAYDLLTPDKIRVEIKTFAYIQNWQQSKLSVPRFSIRQAYGWDPDTDKFTDTIARHSDVYVFCLHHHKDQATVDPLDLSQWIFMVLLTVRIETLGSQKSLGLSTIKSLGALETSYGDIYRTIKAVTKNTT